MKTAYLESLNHITIRESPEPELRPGAIKIKPAVCGICGSDVHLYHFGASGTFKVSFPYILGHECAGTVLEAAPDVRNFQPGDRVAVEPGVPCGKCEMCRTGKYNLCREIRFLAAPPTNGCLRETIVHPSEFCYKLPDSMSFEEGALLEPLAVALHAGETAGVTLGSNVLVLGSGCIGILCALAAKAMGARMVAIHDLLPARIDFAERLGLIPLQSLPTPVKDEGFDCAIDAAGASQTLDQAIRALRPGGTLACVGLARDTADAFDLARVLQKELLIRGVFRYRNNYPMAIRAVEEGLIDVKKIISNRYSFEQTPRAFQEAVEKKAAIIKGVIHF